MPAWDGRPMRATTNLIKFGSKGNIQGEAATAAITELVSGLDLACYLNGRSSYDRTIGSCRMPGGRDVAGEMITGGHCNRYW